MCLGKNCIEKILCYFCWNITKMFCFIIVSGEVPDIVKLRMEILIFGHLAGFEFFNDIINRSFWKLSV